MDPPDHKDRHLRRRRNVGYFIDSDIEPESTSDHSYTPTPRDEYRTFMEEDASGEPCMPSLLPQYADAADADGFQLSPAERLIDVFAPLGELKEATGDHEYEKILGRLLTEWYVVGASVRTADRIIRPANSNMPVPVTRSCGVCPMFQREPCIT